jgi:biotin carboxyl carrier protein
MSQVKATTDCVISDLLKKDGDTVSGGEEIIIVEAMKMMIPLVTPQDGVIKYKCKQFDFAYAGQILAEVE